LQHPQDAFKASPIRYPGTARLSRLRGGSGNKDPTNSHCASVNSFCRFFMAEDHHLNRLTRKYLI
jgi:hypothetical protein